MGKRERVNASSFQEYYDLLVELQDNNAKYSLTSTIYHQSITKYAHECDSFTEFGIAQGTTLAAALFTLPSKVRAYDINLTWYNLASNLFESYSQEHNVDLKVFEADTSSCVVIDPTDMLHIDSKHTYEHALAELERHAKQVRKYIIFHDTTLHSEVFDAINYYIDNYDSSWRIIEKYEPRVGYTVIERK